MRVPLLAALVVAAALAGCAGSTDDGSGPGPAASASTTTTGPPPKPIVYVDTLHLLDAPNMALALPDGGSEYETGTAGNFGPGGGGGGNNDGPPSTWSYQLSGFSNVTGAEVQVWIDVKEQLVQTPPFFPGQEPCTWYVQLALGADSEPERHCLTEPVGPIAAGIKMLSFNLVGLDAELEANETIELVFGRTVFSASQEDAVYVLSGTEEHDSRIVLKGLKEALPE